jgi:SAM-dependent methyltransferase
VIEVGAGTGKASPAFAARQVSLTCVEPDERMATLLADRLADYPLAGIVHGGFEQWDGPADQFGLLVSATAWHWVEPEVRWTKAVEVLRPGAAIALCWNVFRIVDPDVFTALAEAHRRHDLAKLLFDPADASQVYDDDLADS